MLGIFLAFASCRRHRNRLVESNAGTGTVTANALNVRACPGTNYAVIGSLYYGNTVGLVNRVGDWWQINFNGRTAYVFAQYINVNGGGGGGMPPNPAGNIKQGDSRFNANIRRWGCGFMSSCYCGGVNDIGGCNALYNAAVNSGAMRATCYINDWSAIARICGKARGARWASRGERPAANEKEILQCANGRTSMHFVVGNGYSIIYDPAYNGFVSYGDCQNKRFFQY